MFSPSDEIYQSHPSSAAPMHETDVPISLPLTGILLSVLPSNAARPTTVPIHILPERSHFRDIIVLLGSPLLMVSVLMLSPSMIAMPPPRVPTQILPRGSTSIDLMRSSGKP